MLAAHVNFPGPRRRDGDTDPSACPGHRGRPRCLLASKGLIKWHANSLPPTESIASSRWHRTRTLAEALSSAEIR